MDDNFAKRYEQKSDIDMPDKKPKDKAKTDVLEKTADEIRIETLAVDSQRRVDIRQIFKQFEGHDDLLNRCLDDSSINIEQARADLLKKLGDESKSLGAEPDAHRLSMGDDQVDKTRAAISDALLHRSNWTNEKGLTPRHSG